jgi:hypothetical protein
MNLYCNPLTLTIPPLVEGYDVTQPIEPHTSVSLNQINPKIKEFLYDLGISVSWIEIFYRKAKQNSSIHVDNLLSDFTKINWVYNGTHSRMFWFTVKDHAISKPASTTIVNTKYIAYDFSEVDIVYSTNILGPALVQVGVPHLISNPMEARYCLSFTITDLEGNRLTMERAQQLLVNHIN